MSIILKTTNLCKSFSGQTAVNNISLNIEKNSVYGLLGANGAGKSTTLKMITGILKPTSGSIEFDGHTWQRSDLNHIGALIEMPPLYENLTAYENLKVRSTLLGLTDKKIEEVLQIVRLTETGRKRAGQFSLGMKQRLGIAIALLNSPKLLILDEPTNGLDPVGIEELRELIRSFPAKGITVILSSHILSEIESIADTIGVINRGVLVQEIAMQEITERSLAYIELNVVDTRKASYVLSDKIGIDNFKIVEDRIIRIYDGNISVQELSKALALHDVEMTAIGTKSESLEEYFLKLTGGDVRC